MQPGWSLATTSESTGNSLGENYYFGYSDMDTRVLEPHQNPFGPKLLPMSPERSVKDLFGLYKQDHGAGDGNRTHVRSLGSS